MDARKKIMAVLKRQTTKYQGSVNTSAPTPQEISFIYSFFWYTTLSTPHRGIEGGRAGYHTKEQGSVNTSTPPPQEISFIYSFILIHTPPHPPIEGGRGDRQATIIQSQSGKKNLSIKTPKRIAQPRGSHQPWHKPHTAQEAPHYD